MKITANMVTRTFAAALIFSMVFILRIHRETSAAQEPVRVAVAANLSDVIGELVVSFKGAHPEISIEVITGSSGKLATQIIHGAPYDIFLSADMDSPEALYSRHLAADRPALYAMGTLILFTTRELPLSKGMDLTRATEVKRIALADPSSAPYGRAAVEAMKNAGVYSAAAPKLVNAPSVSQVIPFTSSGADIGFTALSLLKAPWMRKYDVRGKYWMEVDNGLYAPIKQGMVILARAKNRSDVRSFYTFLSSEKAKISFRKYGYKL